MVSLHFLPTAPGEIGDLDGHAVVFDGEAGEFAQTGDVYKRQVASCIL